MQIEPTEGQAERRKLFWNTIIDYFKNLSAISVNMLKCVN